MNDWFAPFYQPEPRYYQKWQHGRLTAQQMDLLNPLFAAAQTKQYPVILPVLGRQLAFYAVMPSRVELQGLRSSLHAILGEAYSQIDLLIASSLADITPLQQSVDLEWLLKCYPSGVLVIRLLQPLPETQQLKIESHWIFAALHRVHQLYRQKPQTIGSNPRSIGRMLRDFRLAEAAHDVVACQQFWDEIKQHGGLSRDNVRLLEWRIWALQGQWQLLLDSIRPTELQGLPSKIIQLILYAYAHHTGLWDGLHRHTLPAAQATHRSRYQLLLQPLWADLPQWPIDDAGRLSWQIWWIGAQQAGMQIPQHVELALGQAWCDQLRERLGIRHLTKPTQDLATPTLDRYLEWLKQALTATADERIAILEQLQQMPMLYQQQINSNYPLLMQTWQALQANTSEQSPTAQGWSAWLSQPLPTSLSEDWEAQWVASSATWPVQTLKVDLLMPWAAQVPSHHQDMLVVVLLWMLERVEQLSAAQCVAAVGLMQQLQWVHPSLLQWLDQLLVRYLTQPSRQMDYQQLLSHLAAVLSLNLTAKQMVAALKLYQHLLDAPIPDQSALLHSWQQVAEKIQPYWSMLTPAIRIHLVQLRQQLQALA